MHTIIATITGTTPLLCGRPASEVRADDQSPRLQAAARLYLDEAGRAVIPALNLLRAILNAERDHVSRAADVVRHLLVAERDLVIRSSRSWVVDSRSVRIPTTGQRGICHRPRFDDWRLSCTLLHDPAFIRAEDLRRLVEASGQRIGLGDYRPERGGPFGRFTITNWELPS
jgi:hypothetical protein